MDVRYQGYITWDEFVNSIGVGFRKRSNEFCCCNFVAANDNDVSIAVRMASKRLGHGAPYARCSTNKHTGNHGYGFQVWWQ
ncbi:hypothetical protein HHX47_DHR9000303 [Lentinula edodes]|nr:hypothetical protein HHX47_DHR9000303 [Lentinula edodes]